MIRDSNQSVYFDDQSSGFKWFFNFFFNMISDNTLDKGSIILMDEPATNLHVIGQLELRKLIKDLAVKNQWTFIVSTHSPFLIDVDSLDELRVVEKRNYITYINNKFTLIDENNADVLYPIRSALTVRKNILVNTENTVIFVEGVTDYNYLIAFKKLLNINNLTVLPIQGIKKENLLTQLLKVTKDPILLVDSDKAGVELYNYLKDNNNIEIIQLNEVNDEFNEIEDLFVEEDRRKFKFIDEKKYYSSVNFKNNINDYKGNLCAETLSNFKQLIERLML
nr:AAA family ATPase [Haloplasma contractile]